MPVFTTQNGKLKKLTSKIFDKEKELQALVEQNLDELLGMHFLATEYPTTFGGRIDTLAVDYSGAPVIIEYKRNKNDSVINQGLSYLKWLQAQKVEFFETFEPGTQSDKWLFLPVVWPNEDKDD